MEKIFEDLLKDPLSVVFVFSIIGVAISAWIAELIAIHNYKKSECALTEKSINYLKTYITENRQGSISERQVDADTFQWLIKHLAGGRGETAFKPQIENKHFVLLSYPTVLSKPVPRSPVFYAPTLLTALGVLGTFLGIFLGLQGVDLNFTETQSLLDASTQLLSGMKLAFVTSLAGMSTSIISMFLLAHYGEGRQKYRNKLRKELSKVAFLETSERLLSRLDTTSTRDAAQTLKEVANNLSGLSQLNPHAIGQAIKEAIASEDSLLVQGLNDIQKLQTNQLQTLTPELIAQATSHQFISLLNPISEELKTIRELQQTQGHTVEILVSQLRNELIEPVVTRLDQSAKLTQEASEAVRELKNELGSIAQSLAGAVETIQTFQKDTLIQLQQFARNLQSILAEFRTDTQGVMQQVATEINRAVDTSIEGMEQQRNAFRENAAQVAGTFQNIHSIISNTNQVVQQELETFRQEYQNRLKEFLQSQNHELQTVVEQIRGVFQEDVARREELIKQIEQSMDKIQQTVQVTSNLANAIGLSDSQRLAQQQAFFREIGQSAHQVTKQYEKMVQQFDQALSLGNEQLVKYLQQVQESYGKSFVEADRATAQVCDKLNQTSHGLMSVAEYLVAAANDLKTGNGRAN